MVLVGREGDLKRELGPVGANDAIEIVDAPEVSGHGRGCADPDPEEEAFLDPGRGGIGSGRPGRGFRLRRQYGRIHGVLPS